MTIQAKHFAIAGMILMFYSVTLAGSFTGNGEDGPFGYHNVKVQQTVSDSLPEGVSESWLKSLRDENGNRLINGEANAKSRQVPEEPEGDAFQKKVFNSPVSGSNFGISVSSAGDVNGDGYDDIIVGAYIYSSATGRAYIFYGGTAMNTTADVIMTGEAANNYFGYSVSTAGDVNSDGYSDVVVGAYGNSSNTGRAYIYFGGSLMNNIADVTMNGGTANDLFGTSVSSAGDVSGDGYSDVVIGASGYSTGTGRAYIYLGGSAMNNVADVTMTGGATSNFFGFSVSSAGDVNGDGYSDIVAGAYGYSTSTGRAYIYLGGSAMNNVADLTLTGEAVNNTFGYSVSSGDVNGDGFSDVIIGAYGYNSSNGRVYIFHGGSSLNSVPDVTIDGEPVGSSFGFSVSSTGDINGDGYEDVIAGAYAHNTFTGKVYIYLGGSSMNNISDGSITGEGTGNSYGRSVSSAGDINGDGYDDILVSANGYNVNSGRVYLYDYYMKGEITHESAMTGEAINNSFGVSVSAAGDVNGDGYADVIVGANGYSTNTGRAYIYYGGPSMDITADVTMTGEAVSNEFGNSVSTAGDVNGDGYSDVVIGAYGYSSSTGKAYIYFGGSAMNNVADVILTGEFANDRYGIAVSDAGDVNNDGFSDVIIGADKYSTFTGRAYIYFGGSSMNNTADVIMTGAAINYAFGFTVSSAGDVNGDGYTDVIVGAASYSSNTGRSYIYLGGSSMNNIADVLMTGEAVNDKFGSAVSDAGDVNGDGYADVIVAAYGYSSNTGKVYIFFGGSLFNTVADIVMTGESVGNLYGISVSAGGDVNRDGYSDVIVGAKDHNSSIGKSHIYYGGSDMDNVSDIVMTGESAGNLFGVSVSAAGDVNGDGYSDVICGASGYSSSTGRAYMYLGSAVSVKPILMHVKDVPNDQGGFVDLKWARSSFDVNGIDIITHYLVERSSPPVSGNYAWVNVAQIPSAKNSFYSYLSSTPFDSGSGTLGTFFYRVTARTSDQNQFWRSAILSGRSVDNIAPLMVSPFTASSIMSSVTLNWKRSDAPDLLNYILYRSSSPSIDPNSEPVFATTSDSTYLDTSPLTGVYYYFIVAQDIHGNYSPVASTQSPFAVLNLTMLVQGFYNPTANTMVQDTARVYLRNSTAPFAIVDSAKAQLSSAGAGFFSFANAVNGVNYYLQLKHRNSLETWSKTVQTFAGNSLTYNFTTANTQAYGNNMKQVDASPIRFAIFGGDVNQDGTVDATDLSAIDNAASVFVSGYVVTDLTGDNFVDGTDFAIADNNAATFVSLVRP